MSHNTEADTEVMELTLNTQQCAQVALMMHEEWREVMEPPVFAVIPFETWCKRLAELSDN